jgi:hypothetical protein
MKEEKQIADMLESIERELEASDKRRFDGKTIKVIEEASKKKDEGKQLDTVEDFISEIRALNLKRKSSELEEEVEKKEEPLKKKKDASTEEPLANAKPQKEIEFLFSSTREEMKKKFKGYLANILYTEKNGKDLWDSIVAKNQNNRLMGCMLLASRSSGSMREHIASCLSKTFPSEKQPTPGQPQKEREREKKTNPNVINVLRDTVTAKRIEAIQYEQAGVCNITQETLTRKNSWSVTIHLKPGGQLSEYVFITSIKWVNFFKTWVMLCVIDEVVVSASKEMMGSNGVKAITDSADISALLKDENKIEQLMKIYKTPFVNFFEHFGEKQRKSMIKRFGPFWFE